MAYEIDFHPVSKGAKSGDAITLRYWDGSAWRVMVIDGGYQATGPALREHINRFYGNNHVDHVVSTHPDNDHIGGLPTILTEMTVGTLWMHVPFVHAGEIIGLFNNSLWKVENLQTALQRAYPTVGELCDLAHRHGSAVMFPFQGAQIGAFRVLSPSRKLYNSLLPQFRDTPSHNQTLLGALGLLISGVGRRVSKAIDFVVHEDWRQETLREGGTTAAENESSVVLCGNLGDGGILLTADAGLIGLSAAADYARDTGLLLQRNLRLFQVPHHGSRNNVGPNILDRIVGPILSQGETHPAACAISAGPDDVLHPRQVVQNALLRRGLRPQVTRNSALCFSHGMTGRAGWNTAPFLGFSQLDFPQFRRRDIASRQADLTR